MNFIQLTDCWRIQEFSWFFFILKILEVFLVNLLDFLFFLNIIVNVNFFSDLKFEYYCEYYPEKLLQVSLK